ncbi:MAG: PhoH family protein [Oscillospiraceae bacterium]|nr:PhoH family protein [Oscillospiraceae bacterium]
MEKTLKLQDGALVSALFGAFDQNANIISQAFDVKIFNRDGDVKIIGSQSGTEKAFSAFESLLKILERGEIINEQAVRYVVSMVADGDKEDLADFGKDCVCVSFTGKPIKPKTIGQKKYVDSIKKNTITFSVGPAGTGKTYLAVALAVRAFKAKEVQRIILTRPAVEAGEKLGFLPGDLQNKVDPYLRPLYDALFDMLGSEAFQRNMERGNIEVAPLAYMRGRTLDDSFIILDEAQNTTHEQMKMFLTRLGFGSKMVITGDITQIDLPDTRRSGLVEAVKVLKDISDIAICRFTEKDVVRHRLVQDIVRAYEKVDNTADSARKPFGRERKREQDKPKLRRSIRPINRKPD